MSLEERIARVEANQAITQLASRYAMAVDARDLDALVELFVDDVDAGRWGKGRAGLKAFFRPTLAQFYRTMHQICGHTIDLLDADHATGQVYCRAEHEDGDLWVIMAICYTDTYERRHDGWKFVRRKERHWYSADWDERPGGDFQRWPGRTGGRFEVTLPHAFPNWDSFWAEAGPEVIARKTRRP